MSAVTVIKIILSIVVIYKSTECDAETYLPFGLSEGDTQTPVEDSGFSLINLTKNFKFYGNLYSKLYINNDGIISFHSELVVSQVHDAFPLADGKPVICVLCADVDIEHGGKVWYGLRSDSTTLDKVRDDVTISFSNFNPSWLFVGTWNNVKSFADDVSEETGNVFQVVLAVDSGTSIVIFDYNNITWVADTINNYPDDPVVIRAKSGFNAGDGVSFYIHPDSKTEEMLHIDKDSNIDIPGRFIYKVDTTIEHPSQAASSPSAISTELTKSTTNTESSSTSSQISTLSQNDLSASISPVSSTSSPDSDPLSTSLIVIYITVGIVIGVMVIAGFTYCYYVKNKHKLVPKPTKIQVVNNNSSDLTRQKTFKEPYKIPRPKISLNRIHVVYHSLTQSYRSFLSLRDKKGPIPLLRK